MYFFFVAKMDELCWGFMARISMQTQQRHQSPLQQFFFLFLFSPGSKQLCNEKGSVETDDVGN